MLDVRMQRVADTRTLPTRTPARSLSWSGDVPVDWVSGHQTWTLDDRIVIGSSNEAEDPE